MGIVRAVSRPNILLLESIHATAHEEFARHGVAVHTAPGALSEAQLVKALRELPQDGPLLLGIRSKTQVTPAVLDATPALLAVGAFCIGTDQIALAAARERGLAVFNAPFSNTRSVAELVLGEIIMLSRQVFARSQACHRGLWHKSADGSHEVRGKTLGIVGYGHIGSQLSVLAEALGMQVRYHDILPKMALGNAQPSGSLHELLGTADFVSLHVPDTELTRGMFGAAELAVMKPGAYLINASRGMVVDLAALRDALERGRLAGAAVDVFPSEPAKAGDVFDSPLRGLDTVILTPHIGGSTQEAQANIGREVASSLSAYLGSGSTTGCVTLPNVDAAPVRGGARILNVHRNVPGVLSAVNQLLADSQVNITGQSLATVESIGLLHVDVPLRPDDPKTHQLGAAIAALATSLRTRVI
ncbi:MAG: phosphoglycerate dehydrogenase [Myxococcales bacterium]|nr:phosphoglycerate dehydrogenase [Myxococcales bacterium]